jgi:hydroxymethylpyrimidine/phosphomethylpyrimidine kinase
MAVAAVSAQDERGLHDLHVIPPQTVRAQLQSLPGDIAAFRVGAAGSSENVRAIAAYLRGLPSRPAVVVDPVIAVTLGGELSADDDVMETIEDELLPLAVVITPNIAEAAQLAQMHVQSVDDMRAAGKRLVARGAFAAYMKGGHLDGDPVDVLVTAQAEEAYSEARLEGSMRGSGCTLAAALACELALGRDLRSAATLARAYVRTRIAAHTTRGGLQVAF